MSMLSFVHYRMKSAKTDDLWSLFKFEGSECKVSELETEILNKMKNRHRFMDGTQRSDKTLKFKLNFTNLNGDPFVDSIPKNSSVLVSRSPVVVGAPIFLPMETLSSPSLKTKSVLPIQGTTRFSNKVYQNSSSVSNSVPFNLGLVSSSASSPTVLNLNQLSPSDTANPLPPPKPSHLHIPDGYVCRRCNVPGHLIKYCPTNNDSSLPQGYVCHRCQKSGHLIRNCPTNPPRPSPSMRRGSSRFHPYSSIGSSSPLFASSGSSSTITPLTADVPIAPVNILSTETSKQETTLDSMLICGECNSRLVNPHLMPCCFWTLCKECAIRMIAEENKCKRCSTGCDINSLVLLPNTRIEKLLLS